MFKKVIVSVTLGALLLFSLSLWTKSNTVPAMMVATPDVEHQLSISAHESNEESFINQVGAKEGTPVKVQSEKNIAMPLLSSLGVMVLGLMYFVLRSSRQRIK